MNGELLKQALEKARPQIEQGLVEAEAELQQLEARRAELLGLIAQAKAALGLPTPVTGADEAGSRQLTLHEAIASVLRENGNRWMTARELADAVNTRHLYHMRDGSAVDISQVHARTTNYSQVFEKDGSRIRIRTSVEGVPIPPVDDPQNA